MIKSIILKLKNNNDCIYSCLFWILICHGFIFVNELVSHDSLVALAVTQGEKEWKIQLGRIFVPWYLNIFRGSLNSSWLIGILSFFYFSLSLIILKSIFKIKNKYIIFFCAGVLITNITVISQASTYIFELDVNMLALFFSILAVYFWNKDKKQWLLGAFFTTLAIGLYQSYISVVIVLIIMKLMLEILEERKFKDIFYKGMNGIILLLFGGLGYMISMKIILIVTRIKISSGGYNSVDKFVTMSLFDYVINIYYATATAIFLLFQDIKSQNILMSVLVNIVVIMTILPVLYYLLKNKKIGIKEKIIFFILAGLLPLSMNISQVLAKGFSHTLMYYAIWLTYFFFLVINDRDFFGLTGLKKEIFKTINLFSIGIILLNNVITANDIYVKKYLEKDATIALVNRLIVDIEKIEGYEVDKTKICFIGSISPLLETKVDYRRYYEIAGVNYNNILGVGYYTAMFNYIMHYPIKEVERDIKVNLEKDTRVQSMPSYPKKASIKMIENILVVKLSKDN